MDLNHVNEPAGTRPVSHPALVEAAFSIFGFIFGKEEAL